MEILPTNNFQPDLIVSGLRLGEPMIALTGLLVAACCFYAFARLGKAQSFADEHWFFRVFFLLMGLSTLIGALVGHLLLYALPYEAKLPGWLLSMVAVTALVQASIVRAAPNLSRGWGRALTLISRLEFMIAVWFVISTLWFPAVEMHSAFGLLCLVAPLETLRFIKTRDNGSRYILLGILLLVVAVLVHIFKISLGIWFNFFDIAHLVMCGAIWFFMLGALHTRSSKT